MFLLTTYKYNEFIQSSENGEKEKAISLTKSAARELEETVKHIEQQVKKMADDLSSHSDLSADDIKKIISTELDSNAELTGCGVFYAPYSYKNDTYLFGPFMYIKDGQKKFSEVNTVYDYTENTPGSQYFHRPFNEKKAVWTEPYWGKAAQTLHIAYSVPFYSDKNREKIAGVAMQTISIDNIKEMLSSLDLGQGGFSALTTSNGNYIYHQLKPQYVNESNNLADIAEKENDQDRMFVAQQAKKLKGGFLNHISVSTQKPAWLVWEPIPSSGWSLQVTFLKEDMLTDPNIIKQKLIAVLASAILFLVVLCALILHAVPIAASQKKKIFSAFYSVLLLSGIGFIWNIYLDHYRIVRSDISDIVSYGARDKVKKDYRAHCQDYNLELPVYLPTGVYVETIKFANPNEIELTGYIWQKYTKGEHDSLSRGIAFIGASKSSVTEVLRQKHENQEIIRWSFSASIREDIDYSKYPIDHGRIFLKIIHKDLNHNVVLIPDFESYNYIIPTMKPGLDSKIFLPGWTITASKFRFIKKEKSTNFGIAETVSKENFPLLAFSVSIKRTFINAFISNLTPLIVVYIMLFAFIFIKVDSKSLLSMCSGMFFAIVVAHVNARKDITVYDMFYLEYYYTVTYIILILLVASSMILHQQNEVYENKFLQASKYLYWPVVSSAFFVITAIIFYR